MDALEATEKLAILNKRIEVLSAAYTELWRDLGTRWMAVELGKMKDELEQERGVLADKLRAIQL